MISGLISLVLLVKEPIHVKPGDLRCPRCYGLDLVPSLARGWLDQFMAWRGRTPRQCRFCGKRFYIDAKPQTGKL